MSVYFTAWAYDPKFHALVGSIRVAPEVTAHGEQLYRVPPCATLIEPPEQSRACGLCGWNRRRTGSRFRTIGEKHGSTEWAARM